MPQGTAKSAGAAAAPKTAMKHVYQGTKAECDAAGRTAKSILGKGKKKQKLSLVHLSESPCPPLNVLAGDSKPEMIHPLSELVEADPVGLTKVPAHRISLVKRVQKKQEEGIPLTTHDIIHTDSYWTPVPGVATHHAGASILKGKRLFMHFLLPSNPIYISCHQVPYGGLESLKLFYRTEEGVPVDAIYESEYNSSGKLYRWKRVWVRPGNHNGDGVEWDEYMNATD